MSKIIVFDGLIIENLCRFLCLIFLIFEVFFFTSKIVFFLFVCGYRYVMNRVKKTEEIGRNKWTF